MNIKKEQFNNIFENTEELIKEIRNLLSDITDTKIYNKIQDKFLLIATEILNSYKKDLHNELGMKQQKATNLTRTMLSMKHDYNHQLMLLIVCRKVLTEKISSLNYDTIVEKNITNSIWNITDLATLSLHISHEMEITKNTRRDKNIIKNLKIVKNDLQKQLNLTYQLFKNTPTGLVGCDSALNIKIWNTIAENLTGYQQSDIIGKSILNIFPIASQSLIRSQLSHNSHRRKRMKLNIQTKEGGIFNAYVLVSKLKSELKQKIQYIINIVDLSKEDKLKAQFDKIEQLGAIARLSDAIMHDVRNPINSLALNIDVLTDLLTGGSPLPKEIGEIIEKINRHISNLSHNLNQYVGYSRITELVLEPIDLREPINELILDTRHRLTGKKITLNYHQSRSKLMIKGDWNQLIRVFSNLIDNAIDAIENKGTIDINVTKRNKNVIITIVDSGQGIKSENLQNVFKPYFTTKERGSGLGLFIVREIIRAHHGKTHCMSSDDQGTRFTVSIPAIVYDVINN